MNEGKGKRKDVKAGAGRGGNWNTQKEQQTRHSSLASPLVSKKWAAPRDSELGTRTDESRLLIPSGF